MIFPGPRVPHRDRRQAHTVQDRRLQDPQGPARPQGPGQEQT